MIPSVWETILKIHINTGEIYKQKVRVNFHGRKQEYAINFFLIFVPVVMWIEIHLFVLLSTVNNWIIRQVDFVMTYPQFPIDKDMYMYLPHRVESRYGQDLVLIFITKLYKHKQMGSIKGDHFWSLQIWWMSLLHG